MSWLNHDGILRNVFVFLSLFFAQLEQDPNLQLDLLGVALSPYTYLSGGNCC